MDGGAAVAEERDVDMEPLPQNLELAKAAVVVLENKDMKVGMKVQELGGCWGVLQRSMMFVMRCHIWCFGLTKVKLRRQGSGKVLSNRFRVLTRFWVQTGSEIQTGFGKVLDTDTGPPPACPSPQ